jgi:murein DD-endopeptidase MepM/ murein hydrolase activator NlpD
VRLRDHLVVVALVAAPAAAAGGTQATAAASSTTATAAASSPTATAAARAIPAPGAATVPSRRGPRYVPPVDAPVVDPFRAPASPYAAGNRGLDYETIPGQPVTAIGDGVVVFAGQVAHQRFVTILHPDGLRSSYSWLASISVSVGERVDRGQQLGVAGGRFQLGVRRGSAYLDPARLFGRGRARLVPTGTVARSTTAPRS